MHLPRHIDLRKMSALIILSSALGGCHTTKFNGAERWMNHPEAMKAAQVAPLFTEGVLKTINRLEAELAKKQ